MLGNWKIVDLPVIVPVNGEENETEIASFQTKIFRFREDEWKERGEGKTRLLRDNTTGKIRLISRQAKTFFIRANHTVTTNDTLGRL